MMEAVSAEQASARAASDQLLRAQLRTGKHYLPHGVAQALVIAFALRSRSRR